MYRNEQCDRNLILTNYYDLNVRLLHIHTENEAKKSSIDYKMRYENEIERKKERERKWKQKITNKQFNKTLNNSITFKPTAKKIAQQFYNSNHLFLKSAYSY